MNIQEEKRGDLTMLNTKKEVGLLKTLITNKIAGIIFGVVLVIVLGIIAVIGFRNHFSVKTSTTKIGFEDIGELATQSAYCKEIGVIDDAKKFFKVNIPFTQSKYIFSYDVEITAGINFSEVDWEVKEKQKEVIVRIPEAKVLNNEIKHDSFEIYHESESLFNQITLEENNQAAVDLQAKAEEDAINNGLLEKACTNAETILTGFFEKAYDPEEYKIIFENN